MTFQTEVEKEASKLFGSLALQLHDIWKLADEVPDVSPSLSVNLEAIAKSVATSAATARLNAGYSGSHDDGGASQQLEKLRNYLEGVKTGLSGAVGEGSPYAHILKKIRQEQDPDYQKYLELKAKFESK
jgi:hypothetical protein